ncbi:MAG: hypothetical protein C4K60_10605 [Ideonella sp. MAG2]|nr:MAG: hypothetical protein C4K60_10605 [Ideonella sp. MAG2]
MPLIYNIMTLGLFVVAVGGANAQEVRATPDQFFSAFAQRHETQCKQRGELERRYLHRGELVAAYAAKSAEVSLCDCMPQGLSALQKSLSKTTRETPVPLTEFAQKYLIPTSARCSAEGLHASYSLSEGCAQRHKSQFANPEGFCQCMQSAISALSDMEVYQSGQEGADFSEAYQKAKREGVPPPDPPEALKKLQAMGERCASTANRASGLTTP